jgi:hypothetical protein
VKGSDPTAPASAPGVDSYLDLGRSVPTNALVAINPCSETAFHQERSRDTFRIVGNPDKTRPSENRTQKSAFQL